jgi:hypothetical protein
MQEALKECCLRGWGGFKAGWFVQGRPETVNKQEALERRNKEVGLRWLQNQGIANEAK